MREPEVWYEWATYVKNGIINGLKKNTPKKIVKEYEAYLKKIEECIKSGKRIPR